MAETGTIGIAIIVIQLLKLVTILPKRTKSKKGDE